MIIVRQIQLIEMHGWRTHARFWKRAPVYLKHTISLQNIPYRQYDRV